MYKFNPELDLKIERVVDVPAEKLFKAWTDAEHIKPWFCPAPWKVSEASIDLRPGGKFFTRMRGPEGEDYPNFGCFLEIVPNKKLVWTSALGEDFRPMAPGHIDMTAMIILEPAANGTKYTAYAIHKDVAGKQAHEQMGFEQGRNIVLDQLVAYIKEKMK